MSGGILYANVHSYVVLCVEKEKLLDKRLVTSRNLKRRNHEKYQNRRDVRQACLE